MTGRIPFGLLTLLTVLVCIPIQAQDQMGPPGGNGGPYGFQPFQGGPGQYQGTPYSYQQNPGPQNPGPQIPGPPPRMVYEGLPDDLGFTDGDTPLGQILADTFRHAWFRGEYLLWNVSGPGNVLLGAQTSTGVPVSPFPNTGTTIFNNLPFSINLNGGAPNIPIGQGVIYQRTSNLILGTSQSPTLNDFSISNLNGFRGTFGVPVASGQVELSAFVLSSSSANYDSTGQIQKQITGNPAVAQGANVGLNGLPATNSQSASYISQALLLNGAKQAYSATLPTFLDYDVSYHAKLTTSLWGSEGNYVFDGPDPNSPFQLRPSVGFRYFNFRDQLKQGGQYNQPNATDPTAAATVVSREMDSASNNNLLGPQIGLRAEISQPQFLLGFEPKVMLGINTWQSTFNSSNVLSATDPSQSLLQRGTTFSPLVDLKWYGNLALSKNISAYVAYNILYAGDVVRSYNDLTYNEKTSATGTGATAQSNFILNKVYSNVTVQGISVGFDIRY